MSQHERRSDDERREMIERVADAAAIKALQKLGELTPWDMSTREGQDNLRGVIVHAYTLKRGCDAIKEAGWITTTRGIAWMIILAFIFGFAWLFNIDITRIIWQGIVANKTMFNQVIGSEI